MMTNVLQAYYAAAFVVERLCVPYPEDRPAESWNIRDYAEFMRGWYKLPGAVYAEEITLALPADLAYWEDWLMALHLTSGLARPWQLERDIRGYIIPQEVMLRALLVHMLAYLQFGFEGLHDAFAYLSSRLHEAQADGAFGQMLADCCKEARQLVPDDYDLQYYIFDEES
jgi:hypothetical protein